MNSFARPIGMTPNEFIAKKKIYFPIDELNGLKNNKKEKSVEKITKTIQQARKRYVQEYGISFRKKNKFEPGDVVLYYNPIKQTNKLTTKWEGRCLILKSFFGSHILKDNWGKTFRANECYLKLVMKREDNTQFMGEKCW